MITHYKQLDPETIETLKAIWEDSVKATHDFLKPEDFLEIKANIHLYFSFMNFMLLYSEEDKVLGFAGVKDDMLEMLFVSDAARGKGVGKALLREAIDNGVVFVDVNEQNDQALGFYEKMGFKIVNRSPIDGQGKPYPILHLSR